MAECDFTYSHYEKILDSINQTDYKVIFFNESYCHERELLLRHDLDLDLEKAYRMALIENKYNIRATYFIWITSPFYNIFDKSNSAIIRGLLDLGHQIGLHFDEAYYSTSETENINKNVDFEVQILKNYFNTKIFAVSFHRPSPFLLQSDIKLNNKLINTYGKNFISEYKYVSDSRRSWKEGCMCRLFEKAGAKTPRAKIHALVHPIWWADENLSAQHTMEKFIVKKFHYHDDQLKENIPIYKKIF